MSGELTHGDEDARVFGRQDWDTVGWDIAALGDVDADGFDDFAVGAADDQWNPPTGTPSVYVVPGPAMTLVSAMGPIVWV